ncbi:MAG: sigma-54-dependent Fis family transcriptional regulator [Acidobacteria bacterium]|nr:sigma-54-dependent Fis family transcriptional regulator [Acidobacteriota bacterium]MBS1865851.1 sigma-54-dependent Fis family transcriptional regulator [Acidobacteriota bacterium]
MEPLLLVEDKNELRAMLRKALERNGYSVEEAPDGSAAIQKIRARRYQLVLTDLKMPGASGLDVLRETKQADATIPVILLTAFGSVEEAVSAMKEGAFDFLQKPVDLDHLKVLVQRAARQQELLRENVLLREEFSSRYGFPRIVGEHASIREISQQLQRVAQTDSTVLLLGESGTGKELFARAVHHLSPRREQPFVALNCAAIPEGLVENELFGHERGAFTGAGARKAGKMDLAHRGTLFLDEIGELPLAIQAKLLRVLEERRFERVGGTQSIEVDVRIVVATNRNLQQAVADKSFREDLYFRISAVPLTIPPLRERGKDVLLLAEHFLAKFGREFSKPGVHLSDDAKNCILEYRWPGNVRELQNAIERAVILCDGSELSSETLQLQAQQPETKTLPAGMLPAHFSWDGTMEEVVARAVQATERVLLENTMRDCRWNKTRAAEKLGISAKILATKLKSSGLEN